MATPWELPRDTGLYTYISPPSFPVLQFSFRFFSFEPWQTHNVSPRSVLGLRHSRLNPFVHLPQLSTASLLKIDHDISLYQILLLTLPRTHPLRSKYLLTLAIIRLKRFTFSDESEDLDKSISYSTEAILLPFDTIELSSYNINLLIRLAEALMIRSQKLKQPCDVKHAIKYLRYLQEQSLETFDLTTNTIKAYLVCALAIQAQLESVNPMRDIAEAATPVPRASQLGCFRISSDSQCNRVGRFHPDSTCPTTSRWSHCMSA